MTVLLTGASGFLGGWIARLLSAEGRGLRVLVRPSSDLTALKGLPVEIIHGDLLDVPSLLRALEGVNQVYHAAGLISFKQRDADRVWQINYEGTVNLFEAALKVGVQRVVYTASIFALGCAADPGRPLDEDGLFNTPDLLDIPYLYTKRNAELAAQDAVRRGLPLIRLYPGLALGPGDRRRSSSGAVDAWLRGRLPAIITGGGICLVDVRDAAAAHIAAMKRGEPGRRYLAAGHNVTLPELFERLGRITGRRRPLLRLSPVFGVPLARLAETLRLFPVFDAGQARLMARTWWYDDSRSRAELGLTFRPLDDTLAEAVTWLQVH